MYKTNTVKSKQDTIIHYNNIFKQNSVYVSCHRSKMKRRAYITDQLQQKYRPRTTQVSQLQAAKDSTCSSTIVNVNHEKKEESKNNL